MRRALGNSNDSLGAWIALLAGSALGGIVWCKHKDKNYAGEQKEVVMVVVAKWMRLNRPDVIVSEK